MSSICVVIPIYNEQENLPELYRRLRETFATMPHVAASVIYVNDGSSDGSLRIMLDEHREDPRFTVVELSRNFGHQSAITAGLDAADSDAVVMMDGDLQDPPELIPELVACWREGAEVVRAVRTARAETGIRRLGLNLFYHMMDWIADFPIPRDVGVFCLLDRKALDELNRLQERNRFLPGLRAGSGSTSELSPTSASSGLAASRSRRCGGWSAMRWTDF